MRYTGEIERPARQELLLFPQIQTVNSPAATAECVNAQARNRGLVRLLVRGAEKVRAIALWYAIAHNVRCGVRLRARVALAG